MANRLSRAVEMIHRAPKFIQSFLLTRLFCQTVKFAGTAGVVLEKVTFHETILTMANKRKVQNHIGGVHAVAATLLAESATGILTGMNISDDKIPLLKSMQVDFKRRMVGAMTAHATLTSEQIDLMSKEDKGETVVSVKMTDESGQEPIFCQMTWAWVLKNR